MGNSGTKSGTDGDESNCRRSLEAPGISAKIAEQIMQPIKFWGMVLAVRLQRTMSSQQYLWTFLEGITKNADKRGINDNIGKGLELRAPNLSRQTVIVCLKSQKRSQEHERKDGVHVAA